MHDACRQFVGSHKCCQWLLRVMILTTPFMGCGDLHHGFTRIYCDRCRHDYLLAYSCKTRYFCPSCHQKRILAYGEWLLTRRPAPPWPQAETLPITYHPVPDIA